MPKAKRDDARQNDTTPMAIYQVVRQYEIVTPPLETSTLTTEEIEAMLSGTGLGRKSIAMLCQEHGIDTRQALEKLASAGIEATPESILKKLSDQNQKTPIDLAYIIMLR